MKILIDSYNTVFQNESGGIQVRIKNFVENINDKFDYTLYNKWRDKIADYDAVHIFKLTLDNYNMIVYCKKKNIPVIISSTIPIEDSIKTRIMIVLGKYLKIRNGYWMMYQSFQYAKYICTQTIQEAMFIKRNYNIRMNKIKTIPNGININLNKRIDENLIFKNINLKEKYVLQVGRFDKNKNQLSIIKALKKEKIHVVFIGGPGESVEYYEKCKKNSNEYFHFLGWVNHDSDLLLSAYYNAQVVVLPSYKEIFGNAIIEGGALGANLVVTNAINLKEYDLQNLAYVINPHSIKDMKKKIMKAFNKEKNSNIKSIIQKKYIWNEIVEKHRKLYEYAIKKND